MALRNSGLGEGSIKEHVAKEICNAGNKIS
jgi:hypothetical protein